MYQIANIYFTVAVLLSLAVLIAISLQKTSNEQKLIFMLCFCILIMNCGFYGNLYADSLQTAVIALKLRYLGACPLYFLLVAVYCSFCKVNLNKIFVRFAIGYKIIMMGITLSFDKHKLYYTGFHYEEYNGIPTLVRSYGIAHTIYLIEILLCLFMTIGITIWHYRKSEKLKKDRILLINLILATIIPACSYAVHLFTDVSMDITPFGTMFGSVIFIGIVFRYNLWNVKEEAKSYVFDSLQNAVVVVDSNYTYEEANILAKKIFPELNGNIGGKNIQEVSTLVSDIVKGRKTKIIEFDERLYQPECQALKAGERVKGYMASLIDVTEQQTYMRLLENYQKDLERDVLLKKSQIEKMQQQIIISFANIAENRDGTTGKHIKRTSAYVSLIIKELERTHTYAEILDEKYAEYTYLAAPLHDIGKVMIPDGILCKPGRLTEAEYEVIKTHTTLGGKILEDTLAAIEGETYLEVAGKVAIYHHERWDGTGYPEGLQGEDIPLCARIMAVADVFDALVSERPYKKAYSMEAAFQIISSSKGTHFDPNITDAFLNIRNQIEVAYANINDLTEDQEFTIVV